MAERCTLAEKEDKPLDHLLSEVRRLRALETRLAEKNTELKELLTELSAYQNFLQATLDSSPNVLLLVDNSGQLKTCNRAVYQVFGVRADQIRGMWSDELMPLLSTNYASPEVFLGLVAELQQNPDGDGAQDINPAKLAGRTLKVERPEPRDLALFSVPIRQYDGTVLGRLWVFPDLTQHLAVQEALRLSEQRFRSLVENANDIIYSSDPASHFTYLSPKFGEATGLDAREWIGRSIFELIESEQMTPEGFASWIQEGPSRIRSQEFRIRHKDGDWRWFVSNTSLICDGDDNVVETVGIVHDITDMRQMLRDLERANRELSQTQTQLIQSEKMAALGMLVAGIAHEINTPVGAVISMHDTLLRAIGKLRGLLGDELASSAKLQSLLKVIDEANRVIDSGATRVNNIVRKLKSFARLDEAELQQADVHEGLEDTLALIHHEIKHHVTVVRNYGEVPRIACFPGQLNQVFLNLLINASQEMAESGVITISTRLADEHVHIEIADNGRGIPSENLKRIFDPGFTTKGVGVGTGLGLSICYNIIQEHHGEIIARSEVGVGSSFTIVLPCDLDRRLSRGPSA